MKQKTFLRQLLNLVTENVSLVVRNEPKKSSCTYNDEAADIDAP